MKRILFVARNFVGNDEDNLSFKFKSQIKALKNLGYIVSYIYIEGNNIYLDNGKAKILLNKIRMKKVPILSNYHLYIKLYKSANKAIKIEKYDFIYARSIFPIAEGITFLRNCNKKGIHTIMEIPTYPPTKEYATEKNIIKKLLLYVLMNRYKKLSRHVKLFTLIGEHADSYYGVKSINICNGISIDNIKLKTRIENKDSINFMALASMARWHGYDRLLYGLKEYISKNSRVKVHLYFIGPDGDGSLKEYKEICDKNNLSEYVTFVGPKYGEELDQYFDLCDVGVASLAIHRKNISRSCELKIREYTARGLPFIYATQDDALTENEKFAIKVPSNESPINFDQIILLITKVMEDKEISIKMREYAMKKMTWESQFKIVFDLLTKINDNY